VWVHNLLLVLQLLILLFTYPCVSLEDELFGGSKAVPCLYLAARLLYRRLSASRVQCCICEGLKMDALSIMLLVKCRPRVSMCQIQVVLQ
jgi:hypothetical protein